MIVTKIAASVFVFGVFVFALVKNSKLEMISACIVWAGLFATIVAMIWGL